MRTHKAGMTLRRLRVSQDLTQQDVERMSHGELPFARISRIETGAISKPPMEDLVEYGRILGLTPNEVASIYGFWSGEIPRETQEDPRLVRLRSVASRLSEQERERLLDIVDFAVARAVAESRP